MKENETVIVDENEIYEISFIYDNRLTEEKAIEKLDTLKKVIASLKGSFISEEAPYMRELSYEMTRVVNNTNVRFSEGYFGWVKFELSPSNIEEINKKLKLDEEIIRFLIVKAIKGNDVFTKDIEIMKADPTIVNVVKEDIVDDGSNIDTTANDNLDENLDEDIKRDLDNEIENLEK